jgi:predicted  nucleic acid-binding Zn-ribbon protein
MADSILRLKVESQEYDQKIKRAAEGIQQYAQKCRDAGGTLEYLDDGVLEFVQALGQMDTVAKSSKQQLREMSNALTTLTQTYRGLTDEEKASPFGRELANSIQQLTERASQAQDAMADVQASIRNAASDTRTFDQVAGGVTMLTSTMQTAQGAAKLLGVELGDNVEVLAKLQAAMAVTQGLQQMQNLLQKQSALMQGVNALQKEFNLLAKANPYMLLASAVAAVAGAYLLWSKNGEKAKKVQESLNYELENTKTQLEQIDKDTDFSVGIAEASGKSWKAIHELRLEAARTKLQLADMNYDKLFASGASSEQMKQAADMQKQAWDNVMKVLNEGTIHDIKMRNGGGGRSGSRGGRDSSVQQTEEQINSAQIEKLTQEYIKASDERRQAIEQEISVLQKRNEEIATLKDMARGKTFEAGTVQEVVSIGNKNLQYGKIVSQSNIGSFISNINKDIQDSEIGSTLYNKLTENLADANAFKNTLSVAIQNGIDVSKFDTQDLWKKIVRGGQIDDSVWQEIETEINEKLKELNIDPIKLDLKTGGLKNINKEANESAKNFEKAASAIGSVGSALQSIEDPGAKVAGIIANAIATIAQTFAASLKGTFTPWDWIAGAAAGTATMISTIAAIKSATASERHAGGGFIGGKSYSGDNVMMPIENGGMAALSSGELILNRAQQGVIASQLENGNGGGMRVVGEIQGEKIVLVANRFLKRSGQGELVTWK